MRVTYISAANNATATTSVDNVTTYGQPLAATGVDVVIKKWLSIREEVLAASSAASLDPTARLDADQRCISPSDFGFHNALLQPDGRLKFLDRRRQ